MKSFRERKSRLSRGFPNTLGESGIRELRVQRGWKIYSGVTLKEMAQDADARDETLKKFQNLKVDEYLLTDVEQDRDAAFRWNIANSIRRGSQSTQEKILTFLQASVGKIVSGEELRYVAGNKTEWARRVRELRTEQGWLIVSKQTGRPDLAVGAYLLESLRRLPPRNRVIKDSVRAKFLKETAFVASNAVGIIRKPTRPTRAVCWSYITF